MNKVYRLIGNSNGDRFYCVVNIHTEYEYAPTKEGGEFNVNFQSKDDAMKLKYSLSELYPSIEYTICEIENPDEYDKELMYEE
jgi:hypothetical protein